MSAPGLMAERLVLLHAEASTFFWTPNSWPLTLEPNLMCLQTVLRHPPSPRLAWSACPRCPSESGKGILSLLFLCVCAGAFYLISQRSPTPLITNTGSRRRRVEQTKAWEKKSTRPLYGQPLANRLWPQLDGTRNICWPRWDVGLTV